MTFRAWLFVRKKKMKRLIKRNSPRKAHLKYTVQDYTKRKNSKAEVGERTTVCITLTLTKSRRGFTVSSLRSSAEKNMRENSWRGIGAIKKLALQLLGLGYICTLRHHE